MLTEVGRYAARIPALATLALGVLPVARSRDADLKRKLLAGVAAGETFLTAAIREPSHPMPSAPATIATLAGKTGTVSGVKVGVPYAAAANWILVPASTGTGDAIVAIVEPRSRRLVLSADAQLIRPAGVHASASGQPDPASAGRLQRRRPV